MTTTSRQKIIWITGASSGIGKHVAIALAKQGHTVVISGRNQASLVTLAQKHPDLIHPLVFDVSKPALAIATTDDLKQFVPHLDCVILNAGICHYINAQDMQIDVFRQMMDTNFFGIINTFNAALPLLKAAPSRPHLVGIASMSTYVGLPRAQAYGASKAAATYLLDSLRADCNQWLDVTVVNPGFVKTPLTDSNDFPMPFIVSSEVAAAKIVATLQSRPLRTQFPRRLHWVLRLAQCFPSIWYRWAVPRLSREKK